MESMSGIVILSLRLSPSSSVSLTDGILSGVALFLHLSVSSPGSLDPSKAAG